MSLLDLPSAVYKSVAGTARRVIGTRNDRLIKRLRPMADAVDAVEPEYRALADEQLR